MSAEVFLGRDVITEKEVAIKTLKTQKSHDETEEILEFENEVEILKNLEHDGIVRMYEAGMDGTMIYTNHEVEHDISYIVMEYERNEFFDFCLAMGAQGERSGKFFLHQLVDSIKYLHDRDIAHRDLKLENMLVDKNLNLKIVDFGFAVKDKVHNLTQCCGTASYAAPELHEQKPYSGK